jgi:hypothetical protein
MRLLLQKYSYRIEGFSKREDWITDEICLQKLNLVVGKNATGKSRVLTALTAFAEMITQKKNYWGNFDFTFIRENEKLRYIIDTDKNGFITERLSIDKKNVLHRSRVATQLYSVLKGEDVTITPPDDKLVLHIRRDKEEYPYLEDIVSWAEGMHFFKFGKILTTSFLADYGTGKGLLSVEDIPALIGDLDESLKSDIIKEFNMLGYNLKELYTKKENGIDVLYIKEKGLKYGLRQDQLSQGMFRALALIIFIHHLNTESNVNTVIVDDLGEGLDYERATKLGELIFNKFEKTKTNIQFIASSNDNFLMDVVDIKYWSILKRSDNAVKVYNYHNSKDKFDNFKFSGLSNFDLFSSDYLE